MTTDRNAQGRFVKGHRGFKPVGAKRRKKKRTQSFYDILHEFLLEEINKDISDLTAKERVSLYLKLLSYIAAKPKRVSYKDRIGPPDKSHPEKLPKTVNIIINSSEKQQPGVIDI